MISVYAAESTLDAQLVQDLLVGAGIAAHVLGPNVAEFPGGAVSSGYRVVVEAGEAEAARELIADWQTVPAPDEEFDLLDSLPLQDGA
jgi:hypothetical protein